MAMMKALKAKEAAEAAAASGASPSLQSATVSAPTPLETAKGAGGATEPPPSPAGAGVADEGGDDKKGEHADPSGS